MYYIDFITESKGYNSAGKLFNRLLILSIENRFRELFKRVNDSFGNPMLGPYGILDKSSLYKDLEIKIDPCGSSGEVLCHRYIHWHNNYTMEDILCDPPVVLCKIKIH